jgi:hypothetical protein
LSPLFDSARWDRIELRSGDIIITTPPKCGTTWTQMICALLIFQTPELPQPLDVLSPWVDMLTRDIDSVAADLDAQTHRRFIKSHTGRDGLPWRDDITYIVVGRDPRDVFVSWDHHVDNMDLVNLISARINSNGTEGLEKVMEEGPPERPPATIDRFWNWVDDEAPPTATMSLALTMHHLSSFWEVRDRANVVLMHYDELSRDLEDQMSRVARALEIDVPDERWPQLVEAASFEHMRNNANRIAPGQTESIWKDNAGFFHKGTGGQWRELLDEAALERYWKRVNELASPDVVAWCHRT